MLDRTLRASGIALLATACADLDADAGGCWSAGLFLTAWLIALFGIKESKHSERPEPQDAPPWSRAVACPNCHRFYEGADWIARLRRAAGECIQCGCDLTGQGFDLLIYGDVAADDDLEGRFGGLGS